MDWSGAAESDRITIACILVHDLLNSMGIDHIFMGGFQLVLLGAVRKSRDIDVEVCIPGGSASYERIRDTFRTRPDLLLFEGAHDLNVRGIWKGCIGLDILIRQGNPPGDVYPVVITDPRTNTNVLLPFMPLTNLLIEKLKCAATRSKWADAHDVVFLTSEDYGIQKELEHRGLSIIQACVKTDRRTFDGAMRRHPALVDLLLKMLKVKDAAPNCAGALPLGTSAPAPYKGEMLGTMPMQSTAFGRSTSSLGSFSSRSSIYSIESNGSASSSGSDESDYTEAGLFDFDQTSPFSIDSMQSRTSSVSLGSHGSGGSHSSTSSASSISPSSVFSDTSSSSSATSVASSSASVHSIEVSCAWPPTPPFFGRGTGGTYRDDYA